jgi:hypothetical protein
MTVEEIAESTASKEIKGKLPAVAMGCFTGRVKVQDTLSNGAGNIDLHRVGFQQRRTRGRDSGPDSAEGGDDRTVRITKETGGPLGRRAITEWRRGKWPNSAKQSSEHIFAAIRAVS